VKSRIFVLSISSIVILSLLIVSCKKINEATTLGDELIPPIDNIHTFEAFLSTETDNKKFNDSTFLYYDDPVAIGHINDPEFGVTHADAYFTIGLSTYGTYPFRNKDSVIAVDSVVLSLAYDGSYGDTNTVQTFSVYEIDQASGFSDTVAYKFSDPDIATTGAPLAIKSFLVNTLNDTVLHVRKNDTTKIVGVLRIPLPNSLGTRFINYDTSSTANGAYHSDSLFKTLFRGFAIKSSTSGNALTYFKPNAVDTRLIIYYRVSMNGVKDTTLAQFNHVHYNPGTPGGQANIIRRNPANGWASYLTNGTPLDDKLYLQSTPGSYGTIKIPALDTFSNAVIHKAELLVYKLTSAGEDKFMPPAALFIDHVKAAADTTFAFDFDMGFQTVSPFFATYNIDRFGGRLKNNSVYHFDITRYVQGIVTRHDRNDVIRIFAPLKTVVYTKALKGFYTIPVLRQPANGRIVLGGGNYVDSSYRLKLRIVYSKI